MTRFEVARDVIESTERFLRERGELRQEAVVVWTGRLVADAQAVVTAAYIPEQTPLTDDEGVGVCIDGEAITRLILSLGEGERVLARVHSHPRFAFHSDTDDLNRLISHEGAISIVVPYFASHGINLAICSVNEFDREQGWHELAAADAEARITVR